MILTEEKVWLIRVGTLALTVMGWLCHANLCSDRLVDDELLARGKTTVAEPRQGLDRFMPEKHDVRPRGRTVEVRTRKTYTFVADRRYEDYVTDETDPVGQKVTYLPENPMVHRLGEIEPRTASKDAVFSLAWGALFLAPAAGFFFSCVVSPPDRAAPTRLGGWLVVALSLGQFLLVMPTVSLVSQPFQTVLAFVVGTVAVVAGGRLLAWGLGVELCKPDR